ncbi:MAG: hypothetical protein QM784_07020 [Polyangiaceae bacterium]
MVRPILILMLTLPFAGCAGRAGTQRADGSYAIDCTDKKACLDRADRTCGEEGYIVVGRRSNKKRYGAPGNEIFIGKDELYIRCNRDRPADAPDPHTGDWSLRRDGEGSPSPIQSSPSASPSAAPPVLRGVCRPGETQRCVGPAACEGGQACLPDGSGFGICDCGDPKSGAARIEQAPKGDAPDAGAR